MNDKLGRMVKYAGSLVFAGILLYVSFRGVKWTDFVQALAGCRWWFLGASMLAGVSAFVLRGLRWRRILAPMGKVEASDTYDAVTIGNVSNMLFPFLGEFVRCGLVSRRSKLRYDKVLGTVALERVWDMLSVAVLFMVLFVFTWVKFGGFFMEKMWLPLVNRFTWVVWLMLGITVMAGSGVVVAIVKFHERNALLGRIYGTFGGLLQGFGSVLRMDNKWSFIFETALIWAMYWLQIIFLIHAIPAAAGMNVIDALFIMLAGSIASFIPVPGGFGAYHYLVALSLSSLYGFSWQAGIVFATVAHESQALTMLVTGAASFIRQNFIRRND